MRAERASIRNVPLVPRKYGSFCGLLVGRTGSTLPRRRVTLSVFVMLSFTHRALFVRGKNSWKKRGYRWKNEIGERVTARELRPLPMRFFLRGA